MPTAARSTSTATLSILPPAIPYVGPIDTDTDNDDGAVEPNTVPAPAVVTDIFFDLPGHANNNPTANAAVFAPALAAAHDAPARPEPPSPLRLFGGNIFVVSDGTESDESRMDVCDDTRDSSDDDVVMVDVDASPLPSKRKAPDIELPSKRRRLSSGGENGDPKSSSPSVWQRVYSRSGGVTRVRRYIALPFFLCSPSSPKLRCTQRATRGRKHGCLTRASDAQWVAAKDAHDLSVASLDCQRAVRSLDVARGAFARAQANVYEKKATLWHVRADTYERRVEDSHAAVKSLRTVARLTGVDLVNMAGPGRKNELPSLDLHAADTSTFDIDHGLSDNSD